MNDQFNDRRYEMKKDGFPDRLRECRKKMKLSQTELGKLIGLHYINIGRYERGLAKPPTEKLKKLAEVLGVTADYLLEGKIDEVARAKLEDKDLLQLFKDIESFQEEDKKIIKRLIEAFVSMKKIQQLAKV